MAETKVIVIPDGKICDYIDGKFRNDTPEEYVRQTIEKRLVNEHKYLPSQIRIEYTLQVGSNKPRADIVIWEKDAPEQTQATIKLIIECKKETVDARNAKDGIASYNLICLSAPTANGVCGQTAFRSLYSVNIWMKLVISVLWNITTFRQQMVIWMM